MWEAQRDDLGAGQRTRVLGDGSTLSFRDLFGLLEEDAEFASWYGRLLADSELPAFFWEHPPLSAATWDEPAEFVLVEGTSLTRLRPDPEPFRSHFEGHAQEEVVTFRNLGGDAVLVVPRPVGPTDAYAHLAAFVRRAPEAQVRSLWRHTGRAMRENLGDRPLWLSTAGMGVSWVHVRLDSRPKYYRFKPYKQLESV